MLPGSSEQGFRTVLRTELVNLLGGLLGQDCLSAQLCAPPPGGGAPLLRLLWGVVAGPSVVRLRREREQGWAMLGENIRFYSPNEPAVSSGRFALPKHACSSEAHATLFSFRMTLLQTIWLTAVITHSAMFAPPLEHLDSSLLSLLFLDPGSALLCSHSASHS